MTLDKISCPNYLYEPNEYKKCYLLGYHYCCGSDECKQALEKENKEQWKSLCKKHNRWCSYEEVQGFTYKQMENYILNMRVFVGD